MIHPARPRRDRGARVAGDAAADRPEATRSTAAVSRRRSSALGYHTRAALRTGAPQPEPTAPLTRRSGTPSNA
jgi:hypothetical protein